MDGRRDHGAGNPQALGDVPLHLRSEHELGPERRHLRLDLEIVVGDQAVGVERRRGVPYLPGELSRVGSQAGDLEAELRCAARAAASAWVASPKMKTRLPVR